MPDITPTLVVAVVVSPTGKIIKNGLSVFEKGKNLLQNSISHFVFWKSQLSEIKLQR